MSLQPVIAVELREGSCLGETPSQRGGGEGVLLEIIQGAYFALASGNPNEGFPQTDQLKMKDQSLRKVEQEMDSLTFRNQQLAKRVELLQEELSVCDTKGKKNKHKIGDSPSQHNHQHQSVINEDLQKKIEENERLHIQYAEADERHRLLENQLRERLDVLEKETAQHQAIVDGLTQKYMETIERLQNDKARLEFSQYLHENAAYVRPLEEGMLQLFETITEETVTTLHYTQKAALEQELPTLTQKLKTTNECILSSLVSLTNVTGKPRPESVPYEEALANQRVLLSSAESREGLALQVQQSQEKIAKLDQEKEHWMLEAQLAKIKLEKENQRVSDLESQLIGVISRQPSPILQENLSIQPKTPEEEEVERNTGQPVRSESLVPDEECREQLIKNHYMARVADLTSQLQVADSKAVHFYAECRALAKRLTLAEKSRESLTKGMKDANQNISHLQDELTTTKRSYEDQLSMMSDHLCSMNETLTKQREEIDTLKLVNKVTNSKPEVVAGYFISAVIELGGCPKIIRSDLGTENVHVNRLQRFLREDENGTLSEPAILQGRSTANQRIEWWWGFYRRQNVDYWRDLFLEFQSVGDFNGHVVDKGLIQFCFLDVIQRELDTVVRMWNNHRIRPGGSGRDLFHGRPFLMYQAPELYQAQDYLHPVDYDKLDIIVEEGVCIWKTGIPCDPDLHELCVLLMEEHHLESSYTALEAARLYRELRPLVREILS
ncbi:PPR21 phosphatase, partial [Polypterus senegalus]